MLTAPAVGEKLIILRGTLLTQSRTHSNNDAFPAKTVEGAYDHRALVEQDNRLRIARAVKQSMKNFVAGAEAEIDLPEPSANKLLAWNASATALVNVTAADLGVLSASQLVAIIGTADGAGSGLDADLLDGQSGAFYAAAADLAAHITDTTDAHDASAISYAGGSGMSATDVEGAIDELATEKANAAVTITAGDGLTGGGDLSANRTLTVGGSTSIIAGADDIQRAALTGAIAASQNSNATTSTGQIVISIDGGGSAITTGVKAAADFHAEFPFTITGWTILADQSGSIVIDVWKDTYTNYPPTVADTIAGSEKPTLSSAIKAQDTSLSTWTDTTIAAGDVLRFNVDSATAVTSVSLALKITKTG